MIGTKLRALRMARHLRQIDVADQIHCDRSLLSRIENNRVSPSIDLLHTLCKIFDVPIDQVLPTAPCNSREDELVIQQCLSLMGQNRLLEAQTLAAISWWNYLNGPSDIADRLFTIMTSPSNNNPEVLTVILATMFKQAAAGRIDEVFFQSGYRLQRHLAERGELQGARIIGQALLALDPNPVESFRLMLSLGTTLLRLKDMHLAQAMYSKARQLWGDHSSRVNLGRAFHGLGACALHGQEVSEAILMTQSACDLYRDEHPDQYFLAMQNLSIAYILNHDPGRARNYLQQCGEHWTTIGQVDRAFEVSTILSRL